jgi:hypothetical protein
MVDIFREKDVTAIDRNIGEPFVQHDPNLADGPAGAKTSLPPPTAPNWVGRGNRRWLARRSVTTCGKLAPALTAGRKSDITFI